MKNVIRIVLIAALVCLASVALAQSPPEFDQFRYDPLSYFAGESGLMWVGNIRFMMDDYSDTLRLSLDSSGHTLIINRVLVRMSDSAVVSRGSGTVARKSDGATYGATWTERGYEPAVGVMQWGDEQWEISFEGEWKQWFINVRKESDAAFTAGLARQVGSFPPVELATMTYNLIAAKR